MQTALRSSTSKESGPFIKQDGQSQSSCSPGDIGTLMHSLLVPSMTWTHTTHHGAYLWSPHLMSFGLFGCLGGCLCLSMFVSSVPGSCWSLLNSHGGATTQSYVRQLRDNDQPFV